MSELRLSQYRPQSLIGQVDRVTPPFGVQLMVVRTPTSAQYCLQLQRTLTLGCQLILNIGTSSQTMMALRSHQLSLFGLIVVGQLALLIVAYKSLMITLRIWLGALKNFFMSKCSMHKDASFVRMMGELSLTALMAVMPSMY
jgi:hypothetical protein